MHDYRNNKHFQTYLKETDIIEDYTAMSDRTQLIMAYFYCEGYMKAYQLLWNRQESK